MNDLKKKQIIVFAAAVVFFGFAAHSFAAAPIGVKYTKHNLGTTRWAGATFGVTAASGQTEICVFCHIPHNSQPGRKFLWNNSDYPTYSFQLYTATSFIPNAQKGATLSEVSRMCMSCHDGAGALNAMANPRPPMEGGFDQIGDPTFFDPDFPAGANIGNATGAATRGTNLTNDHPISIDYQEVYTYNQSQSTLTLRTKAEAEAAGVVFWEGKVECVTCHDPHVNYNGDSPGGNAAYTPFLRKTNSSSSLCFSCHDK